MPTMRAPTLSRPWPRAVRCRFAPRGVPDPSAHFSRNGNIGRPARFLAVSQFVAHELERAGVAKSKIDVVYDGVETNVPPGVFDPQQPAVAIASGDPAKGRALIEEAARLAGVHVNYSIDLNRRLSNVLPCSSTSPARKASALRLCSPWPWVSPLSPATSAACRKPSLKPGLLTANHPENIAAAIRRLREDSALAQTLIERGKKRVAEFFSAQRMIENTLASYRRLLAA